ncbi:hypothetical protein S7711_02164 [Stachybotrys chartarum IBT 7711]|uniref:Swiss Army Knife RNA repair protein HAD domain-containing protein n=1 Tax=Stachybotrys chartarum (strain CBS 109288 / IBT 7711) TaxID=1280523 RepID=A0A084ARM9_STACB|nr:hypothetical protein S7711_02164 [Stachybotrys chartarum IBT 7711]KFA48040.1 hypothetical protein S40293_02686 [Stachybotrys chartarum IBT 40293]KFA72870.1 hypothetical protein S40288_02130 [Stachybotrys chartarum IBT 40288]
MASAYSAYHGAANGSTYTPTALGRWSILNQALPPVANIKALHVYDFDNTLFRTPLPNPAIWYGPSIGTLSTYETFSTGGWWHDSRILASTGQGIEKEEPRAWEGWWNEKIVELVKLSMKQPDALCVLLTGRSESRFSDLIKRMVTSKGLEFDIVSLKPHAGPSSEQFRSTMIFKQTFLTALVETYKNAAEIKIYEDRPRHTQAFREFFDDYIKRQATKPTRGPLSADVIQVAQIATTLDPVVEVAEVQHMINLHNAAPNQKTKLTIRQNLLFTGYLITSADSRKLIQLAKLPEELSPDDVRMHASGILICPRPCSPSILEKVGGIGSRMMWETASIGCFSNSVWVVRVRPVPSTATYYTENSFPLVIIALRKGARPTDATKIKNWQSVPPEQSFIFETVVGEKNLLAIDSVSTKARRDDADNSSKRGSKRKHLSDDDRGQKHVHGHYGGRNETRGHHSGRGGRGRGGQAHRGGRGNSRGGGKPGRGRGGHNYRSLDDVDTRSHQVDYSDAYPSLPNAGQQGRPTGGGTADLQNYY